MKNKIIGYSIVAICITLLVLICTYSTDIKAETTDLPCSDYCGMNEMPEPSEEQLEKARQRLSKCVEYVRLKEDGRYEEALVQLKRIWPDTETSVEDISDTALSGENSVPVESLRPMETLAPILQYARTNQQFINVRHCTQINCSYCAPASVQIMLTSQMAIPPDQSTLGDDNHLSTSMESGTDFTQNLPNTLNRYMNTTGSYELAWGGIFTAETLKDAMISTLDAGYPVLANGVSGGSGSYVSLPWYPGGTQHYVCVYGYSDNGNTTWVCDPVAGANCPGFERVTEKYGYAESTFFLFIYPRGIVY